jgi:hypothetical protein
MKVGFTGTQQGMNDEQVRAVTALLVEVASQCSYDSIAPEFHHGDCVGADAQAAEIARRLHFRIVCHPPTDAKKRVFFPSDLILVPKPYLQRNHDIVDAVEIMIATPKETSEVQRSGTWATIRYAQSLRRTLRVFYPEKQEPKQNEPIRF